VFKLVLSTVYTVVLFTLLTFLVSCGTCPGSKNLVYPKYYTAIDFMKYNTTVSCMNSKMTSAWKTRPDSWEAYVNDRDFITYTFQDDYLTFFCLDHKQDYEHMRTRFNQYMSFFKKNGNKFEYSGGNTFSANYLSWKVRVHLSTSSVQVCCTR